MPIGDQNKESCQEIPLFILEHWPLFYLHDGKVAGSASWWCMDDGHNDPVYILCWLSLMHVLTTACRNNVENVCWVKWHIVQMCCRMIHNDNSDSHNHRCQSGSDDNEMELGDLTSDYLRVWAATVCSRFNSSEATWFCCSQACSVLMHNKGWQGLDSGLLAVANGLQILQTHSINTFLVPSFWRTYLSI